MDVLVTPINEGIEEDENWEPYHLRASVNKETHQISLIVLMADHNTRHLVTISGVSPFLGHPKTITCCD